MANQNESFDFAAQKESHRNDNGATYRTESQLLVVVVAYKPTSHVAQLAARTLQLVNYMIQAPSSMKILQPEVFKMCMSESEFKKNISWLAYASASSENLGLPFEFMAKAQK